MYNIIYETSHQSRFDARYRMLGAGALGRPRGMVWGGRREEGSGWGSSALQADSLPTEPLSNHTVVKARDGGGWNTHLPPHTIPLGHPSAPGPSILYPASPTLCDPMNCSTPGCPVHHQLPESTQTHAHRVSDAIQPGLGAVPPFPGSDAGEEGLLTSPDKLGC